MKILTKKRYDKVVSDYHERGRNSGFRDAVDSLVKAIESGDKVMLGNGLALVGGDFKEPVTMVGNGMSIYNSVLGFGKLKDKDRPKLTVLRSL